MFLLEMLTVYSLLHTMIRTISMALLSQEAHVLSLRRVEGVQQVPLRE